MCQNQSKCAPTFADEQNSPKTPFKKILYVDYSLKQII